MAIKINQYPLERTAFGDDDYYDIDYWNGSTYETAKIKGSTIKAGIQASILNLYDNSSALTSNREVNGNQKSLDFGLDATVSNITHFKVNATQSTEKYTGSFPFVLAGLQIEKTPTTRRNILLVNATTGTANIQESDNHVLSAQLGNEVTSFRIDPTQILIGVTDGSNPLSHKITHDWVEIIQNTAKPVFKLEHNGGLLEFGGLLGLGNGGSNLVHKTKFNVASSTVYDMLDFAGTVGFRIANFTTTGGLNQYSVISTAKTFYVQSGIGHALILQSGNDTIEFDGRSTGSAVGFGDWNATRLNVIGNITVPALATVDGRDVSVDGTKLDTIETGAQVNDIVTKTITIQEPEVGDNITIFRTDKAITVQEVITVSMGTGTIATNYEISHNTSRASLGSNLVNAVTTSNTTTGDVPTLNVTSIPADSWVWIKVNTVSGTDVYLSADIRFTED